MKDAIPTSISKYSQLARSVYKLLEPNSTIHAPPPLLLLSGPLSALLLLFHRASLFGEKIILLFAISAKRDSARVRTCTVNHPVGHIPST